MAVEIENDNGSQGWIRMAAPVWHRPLNGLPDPGKTSLAVGSYAACRAPAPVI